MLTNPRRKNSRRTRVLSVAVTLALACTVFTSARAAHAGCGCQKPPPDLASVRPNATYVGAKVALFSSSFTVGQTYNVDFISGTTTTKVTVSATVVSRR